MFSFESEGNKSSLPVLISNPCNTSTARASPSQTASNQVDRSDRLVVQPSSNHLRPIRTPPNTFHHQRHEKAPLSPQTFPTIQKLGFTPAPATHRGTDQPTNSPIVDRKALQLCRQIERTIGLVLSGELDDDRLRDLMVLSVVSSSKTAATCW